MLLALALAGFKRGNRTANRFLAALAATTSVTIMGSIVNSTRYILLFPQVAQLHSPFNFLIPPLIFLYVEALISGKSKFRKATLWHFTPAGVCFLYYLPLYLRSPQSKLEYMISAFQNYPPLEWRIRCSIAASGPSNLVTFLKTTARWRRDLRRVEYGDERDPKMRSFLERIAPLNNAQKITKPVFFVYGKNDPAVPLSEAKQMVAAVSKNRTPVWYIAAKNEGHGFTKKRNDDFLIYAVVSFMKEYLLK